MTYDKTELNFLQRDCEMQFGEKDGEKYRRHAVDRAQREVEKTGVDKGMFAQGRHCHSGAPSRQGVEEEKPCQLIDGVFHRGSFRPLGRGASSPLFCVDGAGPKIVSQDSILLRVQSDEPIVLCLPLLCKYKGGPHRARSSQKATALAAATFRESTPRAIGMRTV